MAPIILIVVGIGMVAFWLHWDGISAAFAGIGAGTARVFANLSVGVRARRDAWRQARADRAQARADARAADEARRDAEADAVRGDDAGDGSESDGPVVGGLFDDTEPEVDDAAAPPPPPEPAAESPASPLAPEPEPAAAAPAPASDSEPDFSDQEEFDATPDGGAPPPPVPSLDERFAGIPDHLKAAAFEDSDPDEAAADVARGERADIQEAIAREAAARPRQRLSRRARTARARSPVRAQPAEAAAAAPADKLNPLLELQQYKIDDQQRHKERMGERAASAAEREARLAQAREEAQRVELARERRAERRRRQEAAVRRDIAQGMKEVQQESEVAKAARERAERERAQEHEGKVRTGVRREARPSRLARWFSPRKPRTQPVTTGPIGTRGAQEPEHTMSHLHDAADVAPETALGGGGRYHGSGSRHARNPEAVRVFLQELLGGKRVRKSRNVRSVRRYRGGGRRQPVQVRRR